MEFKIIKRKSNKVYEGKDGAEHHYYNYFIQVENGKRIQIRTCFNDDARALDMIAVYEK